MTEAQFQNEISIIKDMVEKTKRETANYGQLFVIPGFLLILMIVAINILYSLEMEDLVNSVLIGSVVIIAGVSAYIGYRVTRQKKVKTYISKLFAQIWLICGVACLLTGLVFPLSGVYSIDLASFVCWPILGVALYLTGVLYEYSLISIFGLTWIVGAILMAIVPEIYSFYISLFTIIFGYITPGLVLNKKYKTEVN